MGKFKNFFMAGVMAATFGHVTNANAQSVNKTKAKTTHVVNQSQQFWLNSINGDKMDCMLVKRNKLGGVDVVNSSGIGFCSDKNGKVWGKDGFPVTEEDVLIVRSCGEAVGIKTFVAKGCTQRDGKSAVRDAEDGLKTFVTTNDKGEHTLHIVGQAGNPHMHTPSAGEMSWEEAQEFTADIPAKIDHAQQIFEKVRKIIPIYEQTSAEMALDTRSGETATEKGLNYLAQNSQEM